MGFDERRINLEKSGKNGFSFVFVDTHATKECKERLSARDIDVNDLKDLEFCTERSRKSYVAYKKKLARLYDSDPSQHLTDDLEVWESVQPKNRVGRMFGIGSSDPHFVVGGKPSTTCGSKSYLDAQQSQEVQDIKTRFEKERQELENRLQQLEREKVDREEREQLERVVREEREQRMQKQIEDIMRKLNSPGT
ncbi:uncharacterized protein LOC143614982 [Bidens hawaiensis]|uniref:uncharacterized protein LOC143614982 n=1 Tax=Bidens hawaiensis TaxID=980011 RepID=UPI00404B90BF